jgi:hypothetical protein
LGIPARFLILFGDTLRFSLLTFDEGVLEEIRPPTDILERGRKSFPFNFLWFVHQEEAADVALTTLFGPLTLESVQLSTDQIGAC